jgi:hypothetical protein
MPRSVDDSNANFNEVIRIMRLGRLSKLVKLIKLLRFFKFLKKDRNASTRQVLGAIISRLAFLTLMTGMYMHLVSCLFLF